MKTTRLDSYCKGAKESPLRKAVMTILKRDLDKIRNKSVLEIGCGSWSFAKNILEKNDCKWSGLEPVDLGSRNITAIKGSVKKIPFHGSCFDVVLCTQTMEHWFEYGVSLKRGLDEIHRVLMPKGVAMINVPIHNHGDPRFLIGELNKIKHAFHKNKWDLVLFEQMFPVENIKGWKRIANKGFFSKFGYPDWLIPEHKNATSYILNIHVRKKDIVRKVRSIGLPRCITLPVRFVLTYFRSRFF